MLFAHNKDLRSARLPTPSFPVQHRLHTSTGIHSHPGLSHASFATFTKKIAPPQKKPFLTTNTPTNQQPQTMITRIILFCFLVSASVHAETCNNISGTNVSFLQSNCADGYSLKSPVPAVSCTASSCVNTDCCNANACNPTEIAHSNQSPTGSITGTTGQSVAVACDVGYYAGTSVTWVVTVNRTNISAIQNTQITQGNHGQGILTTALVGDEITTFKFTSLTSEYFNTNSDLVVGTSSSSTTVFAKNIFAMRADGSTTSTTCGTDGVFTPSPCIGVPCHTLTANILNSDRSSLTGRTGDFVKVTCNDGYGMNHTVSNKSAQVACQSDGSFTRVSCAALPCTSGLNVPHSNYSTIEIDAKTGQTVVVACDAGYHIDRIAASDSSVPSAINMAELKRRVLNNDWTRTTLKSVTITLNNGNTHVCNAPTYFNHGSSANYGVVVIECNNGKSLTWTSNNWATSIQNNKPNNVYGGSTWTITMTPTDITVLKDQAVTQGSSGTGTLLRSLSGKGMTSVIITAPRSPAYNSVEDLNVGPITIPHVDLIKAENNHFMDKSNRYFYDEGNWWSNLFSEEQFDVCVPKYPDKYFPTDDDMKCINCVNNVGTTDDDWCMNHDWDEYCYARCRTTCLNECNEQNDIKIIGIYATVLKEQTNTNGTTHGTATCASDGSVKGVACIADNACFENVNVPHSNYAEGVADLIGNPGDTISVTCDPGYSTRKLPSVVTVEWSTPFLGPQIQYVNSSDVLNFTWTNNIDHKVYQFPTESDFINCDFTSATLVGGGGNVNHGVYSEGVSTVVMGPTTQYYGCQEGTGNNDENHCDTGTKIQFVPNAMTEHNHFRNTIDVTCGTAGNAWVTPITCQPSFCVDKYGKQGDHIEHSNYKEGLLTLNGQLGDTASVQCDPGFYACTTSSCSVGSSRTGTVTCSGVGEHARYTGVVCVGKPCIIQNIIDSNYASGEQSLQGVTGDSIQVTCGRNDSSYKYHPYGETVNYKNVSCTFDSATQSSTWETFSCVRDEDCHVMDGSLSKTIEITVTDTSWSNGWASYTVTPMLIDYSTEEYTGEHLTESEALALVDTQSGFDSTINSVSQLNQCVRSSYGGTGSPFWCGWDHLYDVPYKPSAAAGTVYTITYRQPVSVRAIRIRQHTNGINCVSIRVGGIEKGERCLFPKKRGYNQFSETSITDILLGDQKKCERGHRLKSNLNISCGAAGCDTSQCCVPKNCTKRLNVAHSDYKAGLKDLTGSTGSSVLVTCDAGYAMNGTASTGTAVCFWTGAFRGVSDCTRKPCTSGLNIPFSDYSNECCTNRLDCCGERLNCCQNDAKKAKLVGFTNDVVTVTCDQGYHVGSSVGVRNATSTCRASGAFDSVACTPDVCTTGNVANSNYASGTANLNGVTGTEITVTCSTNYHAKGTALRSATATCSEKNGLFEGVECISDFKCNSIDGAGKNFSTSNCADGFHLKSNLLVQCGFGGCTSIDCCDANPTCANFLCGAGFTLSSNVSSKTCDTDTCTVDECCQSNSCTALQIANSKLYSSSGSLKGQTNDRLKVECSSGYHILGSSFFGPPLSFKNYAFATCGTDGSWNDITCVAYQTCNDIGNGIDFGQETTATLGIAWSLDLPYSQVEVKNGDTISFVWSSSHTVHQFPDETAFDNCDFTSATQIGSNTSPATATMGATTAWYGCSISNHCISGMKLKVTLKTKQECTAGYTIKNNLNVPCVGALCVISDCCIKNNCLTGAACTTCNYTNTMVGTSNLVGKFGDEVQVICASGYDMRSTKKTEATAVCQANGQWGAKAGSVLEDCTNDCEPMKVPRSNFSTISITGFPGQSQDIVCDAGYHPPISTNQPVAGIQTTTCNANRQFSPVACDKRVCNTNKIIANSNLYSNTYLVRNSGDNATVACNQGYRVGTTSVSVTSNVANSATEANLTHVAGTRSFVVGDSITISGHSGDAANLAMNQNYFVKTVISSTNVVLTGTGMTPGTYNTGTIKAISGLGDQINNTIGVLRCDEDGAFKMWQDDGTFITPIMTCAPQSCTDVHIENSDYESKAVKGVTGESVVVTCDSGYYVVGSTDPPQRVVSLNTANSATEATLTHVHFPRVVGELLTVSGHTGDAANRAMNQVYVVKTITDSTHTVLTGTGMTAGIYNSGQLIVTLHRERKHTIQCQNTGVFEPMTCSRAPCNININVPNSDYSQSFSWSRTVEIDDRNINGCNHGQCTECQGHCDSDSECYGTLKCFIRQADTNAVVPGCTGIVNAGMVTGHNYCYNPGHNLVGVFEDTKIVTCNEGYLTTAYKTWTVAIDDETITENQGVSVVQNSNTVGTLAVKLTGAGTNTIKIRSATDQVFDQNTDLIVGATTIAASKLTTPFTVVEIGQKKTGTVTCQSKATFSNTVTCNPTTCTGALNVSNSDFALTNMNKKSNELETVNCAAGYRSSLLSVNEDDCFSTAITMYGFQVKGLTSTLTSGNWLDRPAGCLVYSNGDGGVYFNQRNPLYLSTNVRSANSDFSSWTVVPLLNSNDVKFVVETVVVANTVATVNHVAVDPIKLKTGDVVTFASFAETSFNEQWTVTGTPTSTAFTFSVNELSRTSPGNAIYSNTNIVGSATAVVWQSYDATTVISKCMPNGGFVDSASSQEALAAPAIVDLASKSDADSKKISLVHLKEQFNFGTFPFTMEAWVRPRGGLIEDSNRFQYVFGTSAYRLTHSAAQIDDAKYFGIQLTKDGQDVCCSVYDFDQNIVNSVLPGTCAGTNSIQLGQWHHVACTRDEQNIVRIHVDGIYKNNFTQSTLNNRHNILGFNPYIGQNPGTTNEYMHGLIGSVRAFKTNIYDEVPFTPPTQLSMQNCGTYLDKPTVTTVCFKIVTTEGGFVQILLDRKAGKGYEIQFNTRYYRKNDVVMNECFTGPSVIDWNVAVENTHSDDEWIGSIMANNEPMFCLNCQHEYFRTTSIVVDKNTYAYSSALFTDHAKCLNGKRCELTQKDTDCFALANIGPSLSSCTPLKCRTEHSSSHVLHSNYAPTKKRMIANIGDTVVVTCNEGYSPKNSVSTATCQTNRTFTTVVCEQSSCTTGLTVLNSDYAATNLVGKTGATVSVTCNVGYYANKFGVSTGTATCGANGRFSGVFCRPNPTCRAGEHVNNWHSSTNPRSLYKNIFSSSNLPSSSFVVGGSNSFVVPAGSADNIGVVYETLGKASVSVGIHTEQQEEDQRLLDLRCENKGRCDGLKGDSTYTIRRSGEVYATIKFVGSSCYPTADAKGAEQLFDHEEYTDVTKDYYEGQYVHNCQLEIIFTHPILISEIRLRPSVGVDQHTDFKLETVDLNTLNGNLVSQSGGFIDTSDRNEWPRGPYVAYSEQQALDTLNDYKLRTNANPTLATNTNGQWTRTWSTKEYAGGKWPFMTDRIVLSLKNPIGPVRFESIQLYTSNTHKSTLGSNVPNSFLFGSPRLIFLPINTPSQELIASSGDLADNSSLSTTSWAEVQRLSIPQSTVSGQKETWLIVSNYAVENANADSTFNDRVKLKMVCTAGCTDKFDGGAEKMSSNPTQSHPYTGTVRSLYQNVQTDVSVTSFQLSGSVAWLVVTDGGSSNGVISIRGVVAGPTGTASAFAGKYKWRSRPAHALRVGSESTKVSPIMLAPSVDFGNDGWIDTHIFNDIGVGQWLMLVHYRYEDRSKNQDSLVAECIESTPTFNRFELGKCRTSSNALQNYDVELKSSSYTLLTDNTKKFDIDYGTSLEGQRQCMEACVAHSADLTGCEMWTTAVESKCVVHLNSNVNKGGGGGASDLRQRRCVVRLPAKICQENDRRAITSNIKSRSGPSSTLEYGGSVSWLLNRTITPFLVENEPTKFRFNASTWNLFQFKVRFQSHERSGGTVTSANKNKWRSPGFTTSTVPAFSTVKFRKAENDTAGSCGGTTNGGCGYPDGYMVKVHDDAVQSLKNIPDYIDRQVSPEDQVKTTIEHVPRNPGLVFLNYRLEGKTINRLYCCRIDAVHNIQKTFYHGCSNCNAGVFNDYTFFPWGEQEARDFCLKLLPNKGALAADVFKTGPCSGDEFREQETTVAIRRTTPTASLTYCYNCPSGYKMAVNNGHSNTVCARCDSGKDTNGKDGWTKHCFQCIPGKYSNSNMFECQACPSG